MATTQEYAAFVCGQIQGEWEVRSKKMFGEYMVYVNDKPVFLVCDNTVFVKQLPAVQALMDGSDKGVPYPGAKEHYILDVEDRDLLERVLPVLVDATPLPKPRRKGKR